MNDRRGSLYLFTGLLIGFGLGLIYSLLIHPVAYVDAAPHALDQKSKEQYMALVALAYEDNGDIGRASSRLALLEVENPERALAALAQQKLADGGSPDQAKALARLSVDLGGSPAEPGPKTIQEQATTSPEEHITLTPTQPAAITPTPAE